MPNVFCQKCGSASPLGSNFCGTCGNPLTSSAQSQQNNNPPPNNQSHASAHRPTSGRRPQAEINYQSEEEAKAEVQDLADRTTLSLNIKGVSKKVGEQVNLASVFGDGAVGFRNLGAQSELHDGQKAYTGSDPAKAARQFFGKKYEKTTIEMSGNE